MPKLALLDGHSLAYRAFFALPSDLMTPAGQVTNAAYGFTAMLIKLLGDEHLDGIAVAWDTPAATFRNDQYPEYKAQRTAAPDLFRSQLPLIKEVAEVMQIPQFEMPGFEADDVIATLATRAAVDGWDVIVVTGDRDAFQLIDSSINVLYTRRGISDTIMAGAEYVSDRYGVSPERYPDYAALRGDPSDNLPGVPGVGEKTATKLMQQYGSLEGIFEHLDEHTPKLRHNLEQARDQVMLNRQLITLVRDVALDTTTEELRSNKWDPSAVRTVFDGLAFRTLWQRLQEIGGAAEQASGEVVSVEVTTVLDAEKVADLGASTMAIEPVWDKSELAGLMVAAGEAQARFVPDEAMDGLTAALADQGVAKVMHDAKQVMRLLFEHEIEFEGLAFDTALAAYVINPAERTPGLADLAARVLALEVDSVDEASDGGADGQGTLSFDATGPDLDAAGRRAVAVERLVAPLQEQLEARGGSALYHEIELPLVPVLARMETAGIGVDRAYLSDLGSGLRDRLAELEKGIYEDAGAPFNINSTLQLREVLFERLELPVLKKTPKGAPSTDASILVKLVDDHPLVQKLLDYRELEKLRSTYVDGLLPLIGPDGRIHARFNQTGAATGRLSSEQPNLQNIPVRSEEGLTIRRAFVPAPGRLFIAADYSQIELRILAHLSGDAGLLDAFSRGEDIHLTTASRVFETPPDEVTQGQRRFAKVINFGVLYGMEAYGLAQRLKISTEEARDHIDAYFAQFPDIRDFLQGIVSAAKDTGYTTTLLGRRRYLPELSSTNFRDRQMGERMALNAPIQGSAADIIKKAMVALDQELKNRDEATLLLQVHDELVLEADEAAVEQVAQLTTEMMEGVVELQVSLKVDLATGANWADCKP